jgi:xanthine dehydrogenase accessory factor
MLWELNRIASRKSGPFGGEARGKRKKYIVLHSSYNSQHQSVMRGTSAELSEVDRLLALWKECKSIGDEVALATLVRVQGSSYRKTGARMLVAASGRRAGTLSGGCLEGEVCRKIWWLTKQGPRVESYATSGTTADYASSSSLELGCGGSIDILLETGLSARAAMDTLQSSVEDRIGHVIVCVVESTHPEVHVGSYALSTRQNVSLSPGSAYAALLALAEDVSRARQSRSTILTVENHCVHVFSEYIAPPPAIIIFGAGDDSKPVAHLSRMMGWRVTVSDTRAHLLTADRFPEAHVLLPLKTNQPFPVCLARNFDAAVIMTHSLDQDRYLLSSLLPNSLLYLGILGARHRTHRLLEHVADSLRLDLADCYTGLHSPVGLNIGATTPEAIALSIVAEIQATFASAADSTYEAPASRPLNRWISEAVNERSAAHA